MKSLTLNNKNKIPVLGLGTWQSDKNLVTHAVEKAVLDYGYRHIDCASNYGNEKEIGEAFQKIFSTKKIKREDIFVTSKLWNTEHNPKRVEKACKKSLRVLKLKYLDLYLIHWGIPFEHGKSKEPMGRNGIVKTENVSIQETWNAMEALVKKGMVKSIGVANFTAPMVIDLLTYAGVKPAVSQIEIHPYNTQSELVEYCKKMHIKTTAYSPLGSSGNLKEKPLSDKVVLRIAKKNKKTPAQVLIRWSLQSGLIVIPKSTSVIRIAENANVFDFKLTQAEMKKINALNKNKRFLDPIDWWGIPYFK